MGRSVEVTPEGKKVMEDLGTEIVEKLKGEFFEVEGAPTATVKYEAGNFKKKPLFGGWLFQFEYAYVGASGVIIFGMSPEDAQEYQFIEAPAKELDKIFPFMGGKIAEAFELEGENMKTIVDELLVKRLWEREEAVAKAKVEAETTLGALPTFGAF